MATVAFAAAHHKFAKGVMGLERSTSTNNFGETLSYFKIKSLIILPKNSNILLLYLTLVLSQNMNLFFFSLKRKHESLATNMPQTNKPRSNVKSKGREGVKKR